MADIIRNPRRQSSPWREVQRLNERMSLLNRVPNFAFEPVSIEVFHHACLYSHGLYSLMKMLLEMDN